MRGERKCGFKKEVERVRDLADGSSRGDLEQGQGERNSPITASAPSPDPLPAPSSLHSAANLMKELRPVSIMSTEERKQHTHVLEERPGRSATRVSAQTHTNFVFL